MGIMEMKFIEVENNNMYKKLIFLFLLVWGVKGFSQTTFFNEVDYKTAAPNQCLEIISPESEDRTGWNVHIYNENGFLIESIDLGVIVPTTTINDLDIIIVDVVLLTDPKGGMVIEDDAGTIVQFLNYGSGTLTAQDGPANGQTSENIGEQTVAGLSLQLTGTGSDYDDFIATGGWALPGAATCGAQNLLQTLLSPLPVELIYFKALKEDNHILTKWATASETNSFYYLVERSINGRDFEEIYRTAAAGHSEEELSYSFIDRYPPNGRLYYRLVEVDFDGLTMKSDIVVVQNAIQEEPTYVFPNPVEGEIHLVLPKEMDYVRIEIYDLITGRKHIHKRIEEPAYRIDLNTNHLEPGQYLVRLRSRGYIHEQRFVKIHTR